MATVRTIVLILAILAVVKGLWLLVIPASAQRTVDWWLRIPVVVGRQLGVTLIVAGIILIGVAVAAITELTVAIVIIVGTLWVLAGLLYLYPPILQTVGRPFGVNGPIWLMRAAGAVAVLFAMALLWVYWRGGA